MPTQNALTVSELNREVKRLLDTQMGFVSVIGEVSNLTKHRSGHAYFSLKDANAHIRCAFFAQSQRNNPVDFTEGMQVIAKGNVSLYEARGDYQLIIYTLEEAGIGALYRQFELLKKKLAAEGLFDNQFKKALPTYPQTIGIITSPQAAAFRDILITLSRRYPFADIQLYASEVQGQTAPQQLCRAIQQACQEQKADLLLLARGGGSLEDLWAFNDEGLARVIFSASIPIVTGIGHETDTTIADFVADVRAATPTAAATIATPDQFTLLRQLRQAETHLSQHLIHRLNAWIAQTEQLYFRLKHQAPLLTKQTQKLDFLLLQLEKNVQWRLAQTQTELRALQKILLTSVHHLLAKSQQHLNLPCRALTALNPLEILNRGFAIASQNGHVLTDAAQVDHQAVVHVRLAKGELVCYPKI